MTPSLLTPTSASDEAIRQAVAVWDGAEQVWSQLAPAWRDRLGPPPAPDLGCLEALVRDHAASVRLDPERVHVSWLVRALKEEPSSIQRAVVFFSPAPVADALRAALSWDHQITRPDRRPHPLAINWLLAIWSERLVGGPPPSPLDPPAIRILADLDRPARARRLTLVGLVKYAYDPDANPAPSWTQSDVDLFHQLQQDWGERDPRLIQATRLDLHHDQSATRDPMRLGLVTIGRRLAAADPQRARWALQHLPYDVAKFVRSQMRRATPLLPEPLLDAWERRVLDRASQLDPFTEESAA